MALRLRQQGPAVELFAMLCGKYGLDPLADGTVISHKEGCARGIASNHGDPEHLWAQLGMGYTMDGFRRAVRAAMDGGSSGTDGYTRIMGRAEATAEQMRAYLKAKNPETAQSVLDMVSLYLSEGETEGVKGNSFDTPLLGIRAQVQHLKAYASVEGLRNACIDPRFKYVTRGCAEYVEWLGQKENPAGKGWAAGPAGGWYRVRKTWGDVASQKRAYKVLENAKKCADGNPGHSVFDESGNVMYDGTERFKPYLVRISISDLNIRKGPGTDCAKTGKYTGAGIFTIVEEADGEGASRWGRLKSEAGWISLDFCERV